MIILKGQILIKPLRLTGCPSRLSVWPGETHQEQHDHKGVAVFQQM